MREIVREVVGLMPYEKRILDMIKSGGSSAEKRIYKFSKKRVRICLNVAAAVAAARHAWLQLPRFNPSHLLNDRC